MTPDEQTEIIKRAVKKAHKEFLEEQFARFGKWSLCGIGAMCLVALTYFILSANGWQPPIGH